MRERERDNCICTYNYAYICMYIHLRMCTYIYIYIYNCSYLGGAEVAVQEVGLPPEEVHAVRDALGVHDADGDLCLVAVLFMCYVDCLHFLLVLHVVLFISICLSKEIIGCFCLVCCLCWFCLFMMRMDMYIYIYIYTHVYIYIYRERDFFMYV